jgi:hypothetical protein
MTLKEWNAKQIEEALSDVNRYYFFLKYGRPAKNDQELILYYIEFGGARDFRKEHVT